MEQVETMAVLRDNLREVISPYDITIEIDNQKYNITVPDIIFLDKIRH